MPFVDYDDLLERQKMEAHLLRPRWGREQFHRFAFWVKQDGHLSKSPGHHTLTDEERARLDALGDPFDTYGVKGSIRHLRTATFSMGAK